MTTQKRPVSVAQQLVDDVMAAGGSLVVQQGNYWEKGRVDYEKRVQGAHRHRKVPTGKRLAITRLPAGEMRIDLVDAPDGTDIELSPVPVPERVTRYHSAVRAFRSTQTTIGSHVLLSRVRCGSCRD